MEFADGRVHYYKGEKGAERVVRDDAVLRGRERCGEDGNMEFADGQANCFERCAPRFANGRVPDY